ncbi:hypothetical protein Ciccas_009879 [Cichlidogyrus casuarinus]|uniref:Major facilitator superfamily (MFS) profile domain-containing protein n=1 Tax=Cichlidogyrus casuarinus TaxID=1844966 RepID=A0ABD2PW08_9PLAT
MSAETAKNPDDDKVSSHGSIGPLITSSSWIKDDPNATDELAVPNLLDDHSEIDRRTSGPCQVVKAGRGHPGMHISVITALWQLFTGIDRSLVTPTLFLYLEHYWGKEAAEKYYGLVSASFGLSILVGIPFFGFAASKGVRVKVLLFISNILEIVGNLIYSTASNPLMCFLGRFLSGLGGGTESPLFADVTRSVEEKNRTPYVIAIAVGKVLGLAIGPILTLAFAKIQVVHNETFNVYTAPGFVMAILWFLHTVSLIWYPIVNSKGLLVDMTSYKYSGRSLLKHIFIEESPPDARNYQGWQIIRRQFDGLGVFKNYAILVMMFTIFVGSFDSMCLEAFLPYVAVKHYGWTEKEVSYVYIGVFLVLLPATGMMYFTSKRLQDRTTLTISFFIMSIAYVFLVISMAMLLAGGWPQNTVIWLSLVGVGIHAWSMPGVITVPDAILSKLIPIHEIDRTQTIARILSNGGFMLGMYIGGTFGYRPVVVSVLMLVICILPMLFVLPKFKAFKVVSFRGTLLPASESEELEISTNDANPTENK